jgi:apolipoprotein N-acyltransferase
MLAACLNPAQMADIFGTKGLVLAVLTTAGGIATFLASRSRSAIQKALKVHCGQGHGCHYR